MDARASDGLAATEATADRFLDTTRASSLSRWDTLLRFQTELFFPQEVACLCGSPAWLQARSVLDVGCGNGDYLARLKRFFPDKSYAGIDRSPELVSLAKARHDQLDIVQADFFDYRPAVRFDLLLMRFIVQHLTNLEAILTSASGHLQEMGSIVVVEPDYSISGNTPRTPLFEEMLETYAGHAAGNGRLKGQLDDIPGLITQVGDWSVVRNTRVIAPTLGPIRGSEAFHIYNGWIDLCEQAEMFAFPFEQARLEIANWAQSPLSISRIGLQIIEVTYGAGRRRRPAAMVSVDATDEDVG